jgi:2-polyprenyl-3-methyl-5-hydroxy-6-metoxy-1,4-benzoquinol methylase
VRHDSILYWADVAARELYARGARRVWAFGSFGEGFVLDPYSDVDLAAEGIDPAAALAVEEEFSHRSPHKIDVMVLEELSAQVRWFVRRGMVLRGDGNVPRSDDGGRHFLKELRLRAVHDALRDADSRSVLDLGCGPGWLIERLAADRGIDRVLGVDMDEEALAEARAKVPAAHRDRVDFVHTLVTWRDPVFLGFEAAVAVEVIEHLDPPQLEAFADVVFGFARPTTVVVTTPNVEYNHLFKLVPGERRLADHRFEWTRAEFREWGSGIARRYGYEFGVAAIGPEHPGDGPPTQLGRFHATS